LNIFPFKGQDANQIEELQLCQVESTVWWHRNKRLESTL